MRRSLIAAAVVCALAGASTGVIAYTSANVRARSQRQAERVVASYLAALHDGKWADAAALTKPNGDLDPAAYLARTASGLHMVSTNFTHTHVVTRSGKPHADFSATVMVQGLGGFDYDGQLGLVKVPKAGWRVSFTEASVHPALTPGTRLIRTRDLGKRGQVLAPEGRPLADLDQELAANVVGRTAPMTAKEAKAKGIRADAGDPVGVSGLELRLESTLAATPSGTVAIADQAGHVISTLAHFDGKTGTDIRTTFDLATQVAAERALTGLAKPAALVAVDTTSGAVKAIVSTPLTGFPRAVVGTYPPGSTFKIVTSTAGLMNGNNADTVLDCPKNIKIEGRTFVNAEKEQFGRIPFLDAFARSCNTWFAGLVKSMPVSAVDEASKLYGFTGVRDDVGPLPLGGIGGYYPKPQGYAQAIGQGIGQDQVLVSPVQMASVAAAVASGQWRQPYLTDPAPPNLAHHDIPVAATLRDFMAAVVRFGTASKAGLPAGTFGKTGTAEFGPGPPYKTHAWFVGYRGTTAFALVVEGGGFGGEVAAPIAAHFLRLLG